MNGIGKVQFLSRLSHFSFTSCFEFAIPFNGQLTLALSCNFSIDFRLYEKAVLVHCDRCSIQYPKPRTAPWIFYPRSAIFCKSFLPK